MTEPRHIHRMPPCSRYDFAKTQAWIEDMYAKGWHLEKDSYVFGTFEFIQGEPKRIRCRLDATDTQGGMFSDTHNPDVDQQTLYHELGWHWMGRRGQFQIYITDDPAAPELHTDPRVQAMTIKALTKFYRNEASNAIIRMLIYYFLLWRYDISLFITAVGFWPIVLMAAWLLAAPLTRLWHCVKFYRLRKQLEQGDIPEQRRDYRPGRLLHYASPLVSLVIWVVFLHAAFQQFDNDTIPIENWENPLPFATLQDIFPDAEIIQDGQILDSYVTSFSDWFTPVNMEYREYADVTLPDGTNFTGYLYILYHETRYDWFAAQLAEDHTGQINGTILDQLFTDEVEITLIEGLDCDYAVTWSDYYNSILIQDGNQLIRVRYHEEMQQFFTPAEFAQLILASIQ